MEADTNSCFSKKRYNDEKRVIKVMKDIMKKRDTMLRYYYCYGCGGYHLTSKQELGKFVFNNDNKDS